MHCFVGLLGCLPLANGVCDDVLDLLEGIASEAVIELTQDKKGIIATNSFQELSKALH